MPHASYYTGAPTADYSLFPKSNASQFRSPEQRAAWRTMSAEQLANLLVATVEQDLLLSSRLYFSTHVNLRNIVYNRMFISETLDIDRPAIMKMIEEKYYPELVRAFAEWEKSNGRKLSKEDVTMLLKDRQDVKQATCQLLLSWLELGSRVLFYENRQSKYKRLYGF